MKTINELYSYALDIFTKMEADGLSPKECLLLCHILTDAAMYADFSHTDDSIKEQEARN